MLYIKLILLNNVVILSQKDATVHCISTIFAHYICTLTYITEIVYTGESCIFFNPRKEEGPPM